MVRPERGRGVKGHTFGDVVVGGVVVDDRLRDGERGQSCDGDHGGGGHHGVEDERQAVGHVPVGGAGQSWSVTWGETAGEGWLNTPCFVMRTVRRRMETYRSHPPPTHWLPSPAAPGPPPLTPSSPRHAVACREGALLKGVTRT